MEQAVLVFTEYRGVFFGYTKDDLMNATSMTLRQARMALYWDESMKGCLGLAKMGPSPQCRISPPADTIVHKITAVATVTPEAVAKWEAAPWSDS